MCFDFCFDFDSDLALTDFLVFEVEFKILAGAVETRFTSVSFKSKVEGNFASEDELGRVSSSKSIGLLKLA